MPLDWDIHFQNLDYKVQMILNAHIQYHYSVCLIKEHICPIVPNEIPFTSATAGIADHEPVLTLPALAAEGVVMTH